MIVALTTFVAIFQSSDYADILVDNFFGNSAIKKNSKMSSTSNLNQIFTNNYGIFH